mgnify:CR=1 FL=1
MAALDATVFGAGGFIGGQVAKALSAQLGVVWRPTRDDISRNRHLTRDLGHVVYAIGLTGDFRSRPVSTVDAHAGLLAKVLHETRWQSFLVLSSTRVYGNAPRHAPWREEEPISVIPSADTLYDLSKLLGEAAVLDHPSPNARVARLSNVFGTGLSASTFLGAVTAAAREGAVTIREGAGSTKDYVPLTRAVEALVSIALHGQHRLYNVSSGTLISHGDVADLLKASDTKVSFAEGAENRRLPAASPARLQTEFHLAPVDVRAALCAFFAGTVETG